MIYLRINMRILDTQTPTHTHTHTRELILLGLMQDQVVLVWSIRGTKLSYAVVLHMQYTRSEDPVDVDIEG